MISTCGSWWRASVFVAPLIISAGVVTHAQTTPVWPEVDTYVTLDRTVRLFLLATTVQENSDTTEGEFGVNVDIRLKPLRRNPLLMFRLDESKNSVLTLRAGYRYLPSYTGGSTENRGVLEATGRYPLMAVFGDVLFSDRNRVDFRDIAGEYSWRYRNRLSLEKEFSIGQVRLNPYSRFEFYYDSRYDKWSRTELSLGSSFPVSAHFELEGYFDYQNDTSGSPSRQTKAVGAVASLYF